MKLYELLFEDRWSGKFARDDFDELYHVTPSSNVPNILAVGLEPRAEGKLMGHPKGVYLVSYLGDAWSIAFQLAKSIKKKTKKLVPMTILKIDPKKLPQNTVFLKDEQSLHEAGIYTTKLVPPEAITVAEELSAETFLVKNYRKAKDKRFYG
jgi:RNA:NAD 2'-phosphotransferase (TPT1/KptA family)